MTAYISMKTKGSTQVLFGNILVYSTSDLKAMATDYRNITRTIPK